MTDRSPEELAAYAQRVQARINERLSLYGTGGDTDQSYAREVIDRMMPEGWEWVDNTRPDGPASILISNYGRT